jgi:hypothetical protein
MRIILPQAVCIAVTLLKWKYLRWHVKQNQISFKRFLCRMHWIQELEKLPQYQHLQLGWFSYNKLRKMFIKEFPDKHLHNPHTD